MVGEDQRGHRLDDRDGPRQDAGVVAPAPAQRGLLAVAAHRTPAAQVTTPPSELPALRAASTAAIIRSAASGSGQRIGVRSTCSRATLSTSHSTQIAPTFDTQATISTP